MSSLAVAAPCRGRIARDHHGVPTAVLLDYWGDAPPESLLADLAARGWDVPLPAAPPAPAIEWRAHVDPATGRRWTLRPYAVTDALAVAGRRSDPDPVDLDRLLLQHGVVVDDRPVPSLSVPSESASGRATVDLDGEVGPDPASRPPARAWVLGEEVVATAPPAVDVHGDADVDADVEAQAEAGATVADPDRLGDDRPSGFDPAVGSATSESAPPRRRVALDGRPPLPAPRPGWSGPTVVAAPVDEADGPATVPAARRLFGPQDAGSTDAVAPVASPPVRVVHAVVRTGSVPAVGKVLDGFALAELAVVGTATGAGQEGGQVVTYRGTRHTQMYPRAWVDVPVPEARVDEVVAALVDAVRIGREGDGKVWVT